MVGGDKQKEQGGEDRRWKECVLRGSSSSHPISDGGKSNHPKRDPVPASNALPSHTKKKKKKKKKKSRKSIYMKKTKERGR